MDDCISEWTFWAGRKIALLDDNAGAERCHVFAERYDISRVETSG